MKDPTKPRGDAKLKTLSRDRQQAIYDHLLKYTYAQTAAWLLEDGIDVSENTLHSFYHWYPFSQRMQDHSGTVEQFEEWYQQTHPLESREKVREMGLAYFMAEAARSGDRKVFAAMAKLTLAEDSARTKAEQENTKIDLRKQAEERQTEKLKLEQNRFARETCELFLKWHADKQAATIAASPASHSEKLDNLGKLFFPEIWK